MRKLLLILLFLFPVLTSCSGGFGTMDRIMKSWQGSTIDEVIRQWGYPHQHQVIAGHDLYHWFREARVMMPQTHTGTATIIGNMAYINIVTDGGGVTNWSCTRTLEVNKSNIVIGTQWSGNNCPFMDVGMGYQYWQKEGTK
jgi:hypothetical protein